MKPRRAKRLFAPALTALVLPIALAACDDAQVAGPAPAPAEVAAQDPAEATPEPSPGLAEAPAGAADAPPAMGTGEFAAAQPGTGLAPPPVPSAAFEEGVAAFGDVDASAAGGVFADAPFGPGAYEAEGVVLELAPDGAFTLEVAETGATFSGDARVYGDMLTLSNVAGAPGEGGFPMTCRILPAPETGFAVAADGGSCALLDGASFRRAG